MSRQMFDLAWREFSRRAANQVRAEHGDPSAEVRYYAEKHMDTWLVDLDELPPLNLLVLLRDPRDTFVSFHAYDAIRESAEACSKRPCQAWGRRRRTGPTAS